MHSIFNNLITSLTSAAGPAAANTLIKKFLDETQIVPKVRTWNFKNGILILKLHLKTDRAPMSINDIFLELPSSTFVYPSEFNYVELSQQNCGTNFLLYDASNLDSKLRNFTAYSGGSLNLEFEKITELSIVFLPIDINTNIFNLKLMFEYNNRFISFNLGKLLQEVPDMLMFFKQRNIDVEAYVNEINGSLGL
ncbi:MAG: hypothetical protein ACRCVJ_17900 [Clostridium sp.]|uniref:hypothetical protein n=1 Tax=Clostridium sp. TaxID=1506 RepID=UPI003F36D34E